MHKAAVIFEQKKKKKEKKKGFLVLFYPWNGLMFYNKIDMTNAL